MIRIIAVPMMICLFATAQQSVSTEQPKLLQEIKQGIDQAGWLFNERKYRESAVAIRKAQRQFEKMLRSKDAYVSDKVIKQYRRLQRAHAMLIDKGMRLVDLKPLPKTKFASEDQKQSKSGGKNPFSNPNLRLTDSSRSNPLGDANSEKDQTKDADDSGRQRPPRGNPFGKPGNNPFAQGDSKTPPGTGRPGNPFAPPSSGTDSKAASPDNPIAAVSFSSDIAPILVGRCGMCHVRRALGKFSAATFRSLTSDKSVIIAGDPDKSKLFQMIDQGEMPPPARAPRLSQTDIELIKNWITQGAKFDGQDPETNLAVLANNSDRGK